MDEFIGVGLAGLLFDDLSTEVIGVAAGSVVTPVDLTHGRCKHLPLAA